jgi:hypothetical protein
VLVKGPEVKLTILQTENPPSYATMDCRLCCKRKLALIGLQAAELWD